MKKIFLVTVLCLLGIALKTLITDCAMASGNIAAPKNFRTDCFMTPGNVAVPENFHPVVPCTAPGGKIMDSYLMFTHTYDNDPNSEKRVLLGYFDSTAYGDDAVTIENFPDVPIDCWVYGSYCGIAVRTQFPNYPADIYTNQYFSANYVWTSGFASNIEQFHNNTYSFAVGTLPQLTIIINPPESGEVTVNNNLCQSCPCQFSIPYGSDAVAHATPATGKTFAYWDDGQTCNINNPVTVTMNASKTMEAVFRPDPFVVKFPLSGTLESRNIILGFGDNWSESCDGQVTKHAGVDIAATEGEAVYAAESGIVKVAQTDSYYGGWVTIEHDSASAPYTTVYWHINYSVSGNHPVAKGDQIGTVLNYGHGSVVHLHFGLRNSTYSNTANRGRLPQAICGGDPASPENFLDPETLTYSYE